MIPVSLLAKEYPQVTDKLKSLAALHRPHTRMLFEFYVLQKDISDKKGYTEEEKKICKALEAEPLMPQELGAAIDSDLYSPAY